MIKCPDCAHSLILKSKIEWPDRSGNPIYRTKCVCTYSPDWIEVTLEHYCSHGTERDPLQDQGPEAPRERVEHYDLCGNEVTE
jgi:hypothetical protein